MTHGLALDFLFAEFEEGQEVEVLRVGEFVDRNGRDVEVTAEDLEAFVANFEAGTAGQEVPIDVNHAKGEAGGWVRGLRRDGDRLLAVPEWNELGRKLVGERIYRYLSATIDLAKKVIKSISLVNFPAVKGLRPVELSEGVWRFEESGFMGRMVAGVAQAVREMLESEGAAGLLSSGSEGGSGTGDDTKEKEGGTEMNDEQLQELREKIRQELEAELAEKEQTVAELKEQVRQEVEAELAEKFERRRALAEFAEEVCGGEAGLSAKPEEVVAFLEAQPTEWLEAAKALLQAKVVDFGERGSSRDGQGGKTALPAEYAEALDAGELELADLENPMLELGDLKAYDLSKWQSG